MLTDKFGERPGDIEGTVVIGSTEEPFLVGVFRHRKNIVLFYQALDDIRGQPIENGPERLVFATVAGSVQFEILEKEEQSFEMVRRQAIIDGVKGMGDDGEYLFLPEIGGQVVNARSTLLNLPMLGFGDVQGQHMKLAAVFREIGGDFLADEGSRQMGDLQRTPDAVGR